MNISVRDYEKFYLGRRRINVSLFIRVDIE